MPRTPPTTPNPDHPFPDGDSRQRAETAAAALLDRYALAKRALDVAAADGDTAALAGALAAAADIFARLHRLIAVGWWFDDPF